MKNVWVKKVKVQPADYNTAFAMEFESKAAFDAYTNSAAHKAWRSSTALSGREQYAGHHQLILDRAARAVATMLL